MKLFVVILFLSVTVLYVAVGSDEPMSPPVYVLGVPPLQDANSIPSYSGPHPSLLKRPQETFKFPIRIGEVGPRDALFAGPNQYPFLCNVRESKLGQPLVDNYQGWGVPVYGMDKRGALTTNVVGYSKDCLIPTQASYYYQRIGGKKFYPLSEANNDIAVVQVNGREVDFIVRVEVGVINRFLYAIAVLKGEGESIDNPSSSHWNRRLIYQFRGGVGIGYRQGKTTAKVIFNRRAEQLAEGYAVLYSSGTQTSNHYNMWLAEDIALRVKKQFISLYGEPLYTVGIGGSGGAIQQYLIAQNNPDVIDAAIAEYSYPDMVTQTVYALDCELMEYYFDVTDRDNGRWQDWRNRSLVEGMNARSDSDNRYVWLQRLSQLRQGRLPALGEGLSECVNGWRGLVPLVNNPRFFHHARHFHPEVASRVNWTHWDDLKHIYGTDESGYGRNTWDNVGVQYGLSALAAGTLKLDEFLKLNASIGGWKPASAMKKERYWFLLDDDYFPIRMSVWSHHNMLRGSLKRPAARTQGDIAAMQAAYRSGHIFLGKLDIPVVDLRHYLEPELDMHHLSASLSVRKRMLNAQGHADNQLIWVSRKPHNPELDAFDVIDHWLMNIRDNPSLSIADNRPAGAVDKCYDQEGEVIASGTSVWDGDWNSRAAGLCHQAYPSYAVSRQQAGAGIAGDIMKCQLQPVARAVARGAYGKADVSEAVPALMRIFPSGVCDYSLADAGRPEGLLALPGLANSTQSGGKGSAAVEESIGEKPLVLPEPMVLSLGGSWQVGEIKRN